MIFKIFSSRLVSRSPGLFLPTFTLFLFLSLVFLAGCAGSGREKPPTHPAAGPAEPLPPKPEEPKTPTTPAPTPIVRPTPVIPPEAGQWSPLIVRLINNGLEEKAVTRLYVSPRVEFDPSPMDRKLRELYRLLYESALTREIQTDLTRLGYTPGPVDGRAGGNTRRAIKAFEEVHGLAQTGEPTTDLLARIKKDLTLPETSRPRPRKTYIEKGQSGVVVYKGYLTRKSLQEAEDFFSLHHKTLVRMEQRYGVPAQVIVGILRVETNFGTHLGGDRAFKILSSMALASDYRHIRPYLNDLDLDAEAHAWMAGKADEKGAWAFDELAALIRYALSNGKDPRNIPGSIYGAIGICQFMPSNALKYGADGDQDGDVDLFDVEDAIFSIGRYLREHGWSGPMTSRESQREVVYKYNRSLRYANTVLAVADHIRGFRLSTGR